MDQPVTVSERERASVEDALKHLYWCEEQTQTATAESLAGNEGVSSAEAGRVLGLLPGAGLAVFRDGVFHLTDPGRRYALQVVRAHRLYETYLAQETGFHETRWHQRAHDKEHHLTTEEVAELAQRLGHPRFDPHGDPIPTAEGRMPKLAGKPLSNWPAGLTARVVHLEDEPEAVFAQLVAIGMCPGLIVRVVSSTPHRIIIETEGRQHVLAPIVAANITVVEAPTAVTEQGQPLSQLRPGTRGRVLALSPRCRGAERRRLMDLGLVPGTIVENELRGPMGDPTAYRVCDTLVALRREQADSVLVEPVAAEVEA
jgi:DtxR family Mn-dependent transcriptional regulator